MLDIKSCFIGIDTSNYTTSAALYDFSDNSMKSEKKLLPVKSGQCGLRQSDAVFHHTAALSGVMQEVLADSSRVIGIGVSSRPRNIEGSYMPCFLAGKNAAEILSYALGAELFYTSHQLGHIAAALYSCGRTDLFKKEFIAFHVSGGTTDCLYCTPDESEIIKAELFSSSLDLKAGQAIDRIGVSMGLDFPCGKAIEKLALDSEKNFDIKIKLKGNDCCLSGLENICKKMLEDKVSHEDTAKYCLTYIGKTVFAMTKAAIKSLGDIPVVYAGGVMSNVYIRQMLEKEFDAFFAAPEYSCDNAAGTAVIAYEKYKRKYGKC